MIEFFFKNSINRIYWSYGGKENQGLKIMYENLGIQHLISPPYTPHHVASLEHQHCHIVETGLMVLYHASSPSLFLFLCIQCYDISYRSTSYTDTCK